jgi:hypothetical protein
VPTFRQQFAIGIASLGLGIAIFAVGVGLNAAAIYDAFSPAAVTYTSPLRVLNNPVTAGAPLVLEVARQAWNITGTTDIPAVVTRQLVRVDSRGGLIQPKQIVVMPSVSLGVPPGSTVVESRLSLIPLDLPPGYWRLEGDATARHKTSPWYTEVIDVRAP